MNIALTNDQKRHIVSQCLSQDRLELTILPTGKCNFRCSYCYEEFKIGRMRRETISALKAFIRARTAGIKAFYLHWFGGEPLLESPVIFELMEYCQNLSGGRFKIESEITTNGYLLTGSMAQKLYNLGVKRFHISLDGTRETHDLTRRRANGAGTFDKIWQNLLAFNQLHHEGKVPDAKVILRVHFHPANLQAPDSLAQQMISELSPTAFQVYPARLMFMGNSIDKDFEFFRQNDPIITDKIASFNQRLADFSSPSFYSDDLNICYAAKANAFLFRADGRIGKCTVALDDPRNDIGTLLEDGRVDIDGAKLARWLRPLDSMEPAGLTCPYSRLA